MVNAIKNPDPADETPLAKLCEEYQITIESVSVPENPLMERDDPGACHFHVVVGSTLLSGKWIQTYFSQGAAYRRKPRKSLGERYGRPIKPKAHAVLYCLISDAQVGRGTFADYCDNFGLSTDSRRALKTWEHCVEMAGAIDHLLGSHLPEFEEACSEY